MNGKAIFGFFLGVVVASFCGTRSYAQAPTSQPSKKVPGQISIQCNSPWKQGDGEEAECQVDTGSTTWTLRYYVEGNERLTLKGKIKSLVVLFHPDGYNHLVRQWWGTLVGPGKAIDTRKWRVLSLGSPEDGNPPKSGSPIFLSLDEILKTQKAVVDHLFSRRTAFVVGGASRGALNAVAFSVLFPKEAEKLLCVTGHPLYPQYNGKQEVELVENLRLEEMKKGPYSFWDENAKIRFWTPFAEIDLKEGLSDPFFRDPEALKAWDIDFSAFSGEQKIKEALLAQWAKSYAENTDPVWWGARFRVYDEAMAALKPADFANLPDKILLISNRRDRIFRIEDMKEFARLVRENRRKTDLTLTEIDDVQGHNVCCSVRMPEPMKKALKEFLE